MSTRDRADSFTAYRVLHEDRTPDGGMFLPFHMPVLTQDQILGLKDMTFGEAVAQILNAFFSAGITGWDIDFQVGRSPYKMAMMNHRLVIAQLWNNHAADYRYLERSIYAKIAGAECRKDRLPNWAEIAIRIAVLFGIFSELQRRGFDRVDIAVPSGDFSVPMAVWYAKSMGLPIDTIICGCNENGSVWDFIHRGELGTTLSVVNTQFTELDVSCPAGIERLIFDAFGREEVKRYLEVCAKQGVYKLSDDKQAVLNECLFAGVVSGKRTESVIRSIFRTNNYIVDPYVAVAYGALQDYRSRTGESKATLIMADKCPLYAAGMICSILGISNEELKKHINAPKE